MRYKPVLPPEVAVLGAAALDWVAQVKELPQPDGIVSAASYAPFPGGTGGNVAEAVARLGHGVRFMGQLGDDEGGKILLRAFKKAGVDTSSMRLVKGERSASTFIAVNQRGERMIFSLGGVAIYTEGTDIDPAWLKGIKVLFIADALKSTALAAFKALEKGGRVVFNPGGHLAASGTAFLAQMLEMADLLILSRPESRAMTREQDPEKALSVLARQWTGVAMLTLGEDGVLLLDHGNMQHVPASPVRSVVDTTGAGDAFSAGVVVGMLEGLSWVGAARLGCAAAALKISNLGARGGLPDRQSVRELIEEMP